MRKYYCKVDNTAANNIEYKIIEACSKTEAQENFEIHLAEQKKKHTLVFYKNIEIYELTNELKHFTYTKTNGFNITISFANLIKETERKAIEVFGNDLLMIKHFYYGENLDMFDIVLKDKNYGHFNIYANGKVHFNGHTCTREQCDKFYKLHIE